ncbi:MAG TPA: DNA alkylation repair protein [Gemmataceae bacterium]|nr:DNA alkylation repair protein [Gemmataceae bacterium]
MRQTANLMEGLAVDFVALMGVVVPEVPVEAHTRLTIGSPSITQRMRIAGELLLEHVGLDGLDALVDHASDTVRGWAAYMIGLAPELLLSERFTLMRPLADDLHFGVREWAWMPLRPHIAADVKRAIALLEPWVYEQSSFLRRFAVELTRPRGVWTEHIAELKENPRLGLPLLKPLRADSEKYVQDSVSNWLNDAAKSQPEWVRDLVEGWADGCENLGTLRICKRAMRST